MTELDEEKISMLPVFALNPDATVTTIGRGSGAIHIVDDFYANPWAVRRHALGLDFGPGDDAHFPGRIATCDEDLTEIRRFCRTRFGFEIAAGSFNACEFRIIARRPDDLDSTQVIPHIDAPLDNAITLIVYLNPPEQCRGGVGFYRHHATGLDRLDASAEVLERVRAAGCASIHELHARMVDERSRFPREYITMSNEHWQLTRQIDMRFNRLVAYHGNRFHAPYIEPGWFDMDEEPGARPRVFQRFFLLRRVQRWRAAHRAQATHTPRSAR